MPPPHAPPPDRPARAVLADGALGRADRGQKRTDAQCGPERDADLSVAGEGALLVRSAAEARELRQKEPSPAPRGSCGAAGCARDCAPHWTPAGAEARAIAVCGQENTHSARPHTHTPCAYTT